VWARKKLCDATGGVVSGVTGGVTGGVTARAHAAHTDLHPAVRESSKRDRCI
jgi:hypothetical protein